MASERHALSSLLGQLEESKFRVLFRALVERQSGESTSIPTPNSYVFVTHPSRSRYEAAYYQVAYLPSSMWQDDVLRAFLRTELKQGVADLRGLQASPFTLDGFPEPPGALF